MKSELTPQTIGFGALAGATTAMLCLGTASGSILSAVLFFISPVPLTVAGLGFGVKSALIGAVVAILGTLFFAHGLVSLLVALSVALPACAAAYWLNLARPAEEIGGPMGKLAWYPLADVLFAIALMTGFAYSVFGAVIGYGPELAAALANEMLTRIHQANPDLVLTTAHQASLQILFQKIIPIAQTSSWMLTLSLSLYISLAIARSAGLIRRPREDWPMALRMPRNATFAFLAALLVAFVPGPIGNVGGAFAGALVAGFTLAGFAMLHARTRGVPGRIAILIATYLSILVIGVAVLIAFIAGIIGAGRHIPLTPANPSNLTPRKSD